MTSPLLSICIATRNRADYLAETLKSIPVLAQQPIEIVIVDGASSDNTRDVALDARKSGLDVKYFYETTNGGIDFDFDLAVQYASGHYCWLMSDDDLLRPDALRRVMDCLQEHHTIVVVNSEVRNSSLDKILESARVTAISDKTYSPDESTRFFRDLANYLSFIGCVIIERNIWVSRNRSPFIGTYFVHVGVIFQAPIEGTVHFIAEPLVTIRYGNASWSDAAFEIWMFKWPQLVWSFDGFESCDRAAVYHPEPWRMLHRLFLYRAKGAYSSGTYASLIACQDASTLYHWLARTVASFPGGIANLVMLLVCSLRPRRFALQILDLRNSRFNLLRRFAKD